MKRLRRIGMILAFLAVCAGALLFLLRFTQSAPAFTYPAWETGAVVSPSGEETPFDLPEDAGEETPKEVPAAEQPRQRRPLRFHLALDAAASRAVVVMAAVVVSQFLRLF